MQRGQVREKLLRSASSLGARQGVGALSLRAVVRDAGANLNSVHYHFGSRDALIEELAGRTMEGLNAERFEAMDRLPAAGANAKATTRAILNAAYGPLFSQALGKRRSRYREGLSIVQQLRFEPSGLGLATLEQHGGRFVQRVEALLGAELNLGATKIRTGMQLVNAAAWDLALRPDTLHRIQALSNVDRGVRRLVDRFLDFATAGLCAGT